MATPDELDPNKRPQQLGMTLSPEQQRRQRIDGDMQRASQRIQETKQGIRNAAGAAGDALGTAASSIAGAGLIVPRAIRGVATGDIPINVRHLPDYGNKGLNQRKAANWAANNPEQAEAAQQDMQGIAGRTVGAARQLPGGPLRLPQSAPGVNATSETSPNAAAPLLTAQAAPAPTGAKPGTSAQVTSEDGSPTTAAEASEQAPVQQGQWGTAGGLKGEIAGRVNSDGVAEFSNMAADQQAAQGNRYSPTGLRASNGMQVPDGARVLASGSSEEDPDRVFAGLGSAANLGNGIGGLSVGAAGDSALAMERFGRANEIRAGTNRLRRQGEIGDTGNFTIVRDSTRAPTNAELLNDRRNMAAQRRDDAVNADQADRSLRSQELEARLGFNVRQLTNQERELSNAEQTGELERQRLGMDLEAGQLSLEQQRQIQQLRAQISDPSLSTEQRASAREAYESLSLDPQQHATNRREDSRARQQLIGNLQRAYAQQFASAMGEVPSFEDWAQPALAMAGMEATGNASGATAAQPPANHVAALKRDRALAAQFDEIYGAGAAARILGAN